MYTRVILLRCHVQILQEERVDHFASRKGLVQSEFSKIGAELRQSKGLNSQCKFHHRVWNIVGLFAIFADQKQ